MSDPSLPISNEQETAPFLSYEEVAATLMDELEKAGVVVDDVRHNIDPGTGERLFECVVRIETEDAVSRYYGELEYSWDALMTFVTTYGAGKDCELYHDQEGIAECPHKMFQPQAVLDMSGTFMLGEGGYELQSLEELQGWLNVAEEVIGSVLPEDDPLSIHVEIGRMAGTMVVEKFMAKHTWLIELGQEPHWSVLSSQVHAALLAIPALADRLPI